MSQSAIILDKLFAEIQARKDADPASSYTASLLADAPDKPIRKLAEELTETIIEVMKGDAAKTAEESADLLYHLLVLWQAAGVEPSEVWSILEKRQGISGHVEKASRSQS